MTNETTGQGFCSLVHQTYGPVKSVALPSLSRADLAERLFDEIVAEAGDLALAYSRGDFERADECRGRLEELKGEATGAMCGGPIQYRRR